ncbi:MAG TPA: ATP-binding protein [Candidatus Sumerlaeota bacterium]|nr:ATP-binding protein [Candidatus Sumerlaeota bacterium]
MKAFGRTFLINGMVALAYWGVSHLNGLFFRHVGILPMPIWPAAAVAILAGFKWGPRIAPALAAGSILANHFSLGASWACSAGVTVMNTIGPLLAVSWANRRLETESLATRLLKLAIASLILAPAMTATGGIGTQWLLGLIPQEMAGPRWVRWFLAHSSGALLFVPPVLVFSSSWWQHAPGTDKDDWLNHAGRLTLGVTVGLILALWSADSLLGLLWFRQEEIGWTDVFLPLHDPQKILSHILVSATLLFAGGVVSQLLQHLGNSRRNQYQSHLALQESEAKFRSLFENMAEGVALHEVIHDASGQITDYRILETNPVYGRHTGIPPEKARGMLGSALYGVTPAPYLEEFEQVARTGTPFFFETYFEGLEKYFSISVVSPEPGKFATVFEDITERKHREKELQEKNEELARFTYTVSHDLKSPLVTVTTFLGYLEQDLQKQNQERVRKDIGYIQGAASRMSQLLDELLELSRIGRKTNPPVEVSLQAVVREAQELVAGQIATRGVQVKVTSEPVLLFGDYPRLVEVFQNLLDNAVKFMGDQPAPRVEIGVESSRDGMVFFVQDNGKGIDPRHQSKLFGLFEKLDPEAPGTGIGLALVRRIVEVHGGRIWVESEGPGRGTTFRFTLARTKKESQEAHGDSR